MAESTMPLANALGSDHEEPNVIILKPARHQQSDQTEGLAGNFKTNPCPLMTSAALKEDNPISKEKRMESTVKAIGQGMQAACLQWEQLMVESEQFELFCPTRVDKLLQEAQAMEAHLLQQKEQLINRLRKLSQTLQVAP